MVKRQNKSKESAEVVYRMSELVEESGVSRDMIKYYLRANLLPSPRKPRANLSLYTENHLMLIRLVLQFQKQTKLSLPEIARVFEQAKHDANTIEIELLSDKYSTDHGDNIIPIEASAKSGGSLSFPTEFIEELVGYGLLAESAVPGEDDEKIAGLLWAARNEGVPIEFFQAARVKLHELAELEVKALIAIQRPKPDFNAVLENVTNIDRVINRWMISEKNGQARRMFQRVIDNSEKALASIHDTIYRPSNVFRKRYGIDEALMQLSQEHEANREDLDKIHDLCRACLLLTDFDRAIAWADVALEIAPDDEISIAFKGLSYGMENNLDKALIYGRRLEASDSRHPVAIQARLLSLLMQAARMGGVADMTELLKEASDLFLDLPPAQPEDPLEASLLLGRANTLFPDAISRQAEAIAALETMLADIESNNYKKLGLPLEGIRIIYQIYASFYLGLLHEAGGDGAQARPYFETVIQLDPSSNFGEAAYLKLGQ